MFFALRLRNLFFIHYLYIYIFFMKVTIDPYAGFCFGVDRAIRVAEENVYGENRLYSLGMIVHNEREQDRLSEKGLGLISDENFTNLKHGRVLFRAHGEPPKSYKIACRNNTKVIDVTCPVVKKLHVRVAKSQEEMSKKKGVVLIYGKNNHPEVNGLIGQTEGKAIQVSSPEAIKEMKLPHSVRLYAQTTMGTESYLLIQDAVRRRLNELHPGKDIDFKSFNTICGQVSGRERNIRKFAVENEVILFVGGKESSNGQYLFSLASQINPRSFYISGKEDIRKEWLENMNTLGITGATSTPDWLLEEVRNAVEKM